MSANILTGTLILLVGIVLLAFCIRLLIKNWSSPKDDRDLTIIFNLISICLIGLGIWIMK